MFTGIIEEVGRVVRIERADGSSSDARLTVAGPVVSADARLGDSIAVSGVCLTVTSHGDGQFTADVMPETLAVSALADLREGSAVNLERAVAVGDRLGGHIVQGHVDAVSRLVRRTPGERWDELEFELPREIAALVAHKGSIAINGVSLTVSAVGPDTLTVSLIPTTLAETTLGALSPGDRVNLETDIIARHVARLHEVAGS